MDAIYEVFNFIYSLLDTIIKGVSGAVSIVTSTIQLIYNISLIIPNPLYGAFLSFLSLYVVIFTYKIFRKG